MNWALIASLVAGLIQIAPKIKQIWDSSGGFNKILAVLTGTPILKTLEEAGAALFPAADKAIQAVLAAVHLGYPNATKWVQQGLNAGQTLGFISFGAPLVVDGLFGAKTFAAVEALQTKLKVPTTGAVAQAEYAALNLLLVGKLPAVST